MIGARETKAFAIGAVLLGAAAFLPALDTGYWLSLGVTIVIYTALATSWALFSGPTRYISLATAAFFGVGMYIVGGGIGLLLTQAIQTQKDWEEVLSSVNESEI